MRKLRDYLSKHCFEKGAQHDAFEFLEFLLNEVDEAAKQEECVGAREFLSVSEITVRETTSEHFKCSCLKDALDGLSCGNSISGTREVSAPFIILELGTSPNEINIQTLIEENQGIQAIGDHNRECSKCC